MRRETTFTPENIAAKVDEAIATGRDRFLFDKTLPGFGLKIMPTGNNSWLAQYKTKVGRITRRKYWSDAKVAWPQRGKGPERY
jgi:hypothetical protein